MELSHFGMDVIQEQHVYLDSSWCKKKVSDPFTRLYYVKHGSGYLCYDGNEVKMRAGYVYIVPAELEFEYGCNDGEVMEKLFFHISVMAVENYDILSKTKGIYELSLAEAESEEIFDVYENEDYISMLKVKMMLYRTVTAFIDKFNFDIMPFNEYSELVKNVMSYVRKNIRATLGLDEIARELFVSQSKLRNAFKKETGVTLGKYIDDMVFYRAKRFLGSKNMPMSEISSRLGFYDQFYFSRRFKEKYGKTPSEYRKENGV